MITKVCNKCNVLKTQEELVRRSGSIDGYRPTCKLCYNQYKTKKRKNFSELEKEKNKKYSQNYRKLNHDKLIERERKYQQINKEKESIRKKKYREENPEKYLECIQNYKKSNKEKIREKSRDYYQNNKDKRRIYETEKRKNDSVYRITCSLRSRINIFIKSKKINKSNKTFEIIGIAPIELKKYLGNLFTEGMTWQNYGEWHIDHIIPLSSAKTEQEIYELCKYTNLQPLWAQDNLKKSNKILVKNIIKNVDC
jgi:hypothetical protein